MVRVRKLVLAIAAASTLTSGVANALGLGEVTMQSALNQPLVAEIELLEVRGLGSEDLIPALASPEAFNRAGVDRQYFLTDLKFTPVIKSNGKSVIRVTSSKPIREPYLNFLVELHWPNGRLLREYTLLLDPPLYRPEPVLSAPVRAAVSTPSSSPVRSAAAAAPRTASAPARAAVSAPSPARSAPTASADGTYRTSGSDTLWEVAKEVSGGSVSQAMLAIQDLNPNAFIGGNINRMKSGQVLRLPNEEQVRSRSQAEAQAQVAEQNAAWRERRNVAAPARQLDATRRSSAGAAPAQTETTDNLRLVAGDTGKATSGSDNGAGAGNAGLEDKLAVAQESLESTRRENTELQGRMGDLESRLEKLQRLMQLKDDQLAKLQAELGEAAKKPVTDAPASAPEAVAPAADAAVAGGGTAVPAVDAAGATDAAAGESAGTAESAANAADAPASDGAAAPAETTEPGESGSEAVTTDAGAPAGDAEQPAAVPQAESAPVVSEAPAEQAAQVAPPKKPANPPAAGASGNFLDDLLQNSTFLTVLGGGALLLLLVALMMLSRRNAQREAELHESLAAQQPFDDQKAPQGNFDLDADATDAELAEAAAQSGDVLDEADIYIAYGRFNQAAELLQGAVSEEPERNDLRLKLMEVYAELGDRDGFKREEAELHEMGGSHPEIERLKARYPAMLGVAAASAAAAAAASNPEDDFDLDDLGLDDTQSITGVELDDAFDLSLAELEADLEAPAPLPTEAVDDELDLNLDFEAPAATAQPAGDDPLADFDLDFDTSSIALEAGETPSATLDDAFGADLELPADFDLSLSEPHTVTDHASEDFLADLAAADAELNAFSSELESGSVDIEPAAAVDGDDDFDFLSGTDETATKLDLARAYIDMGDSEGARDILDEVLSEGSDVQQNEARELLARLA